MLGFQICGLSQDNLQLLSMLGIQLLVLLFANELRYLILKQ